MPGVAWQGGETLVAGIGQGFILTTPLQLAVMTARLATGKAIKPHIVRGVISGGVAKPLEYPEPPPIKVSKEALRIAVDDLGGCATRLERNHMPVHWDGPRLLRVPAQAACGVLLEFSEAA